MRFLASLLLALVTVTSFAATPTADFGFTFNKLAGVPAANKYQLGTVLREAHNQAVCVYDYATSGGAVATIALKATDLKTACVLPGKAIILNGFLDVTSDLSTTGVPSVSFGTTGSVNNLKVSAAASTITSAARIQMIPDWATIADSVKLGTSTTYNVNMTVTSAALTRGHLRVFLNYALGE